MPLADYLAKHYLSADGPARDKSSKKKKRKKTSSSAGVVLAEDDDAWTQTRMNGDDVDEDDDGPTVVGQHAAAVPVKKSKWIRVGAAAPKDSEQAAADAILAETQAELHQRTRADEDDPTVVDEDGDKHDGPTMASGAMAGLQTAAQVTAALERRAVAERKAMKAAGQDASGLAQQTIYRDASGRMISVQAKRDEAATRAQEDARKQAEELVSRKGDVQRRQKEERQQLLADAKSMAVARHADDEQLNAELRERTRWNDPMAQLIAAKSSSKSGSAGGKGAKSKTYQGASEPNRYGIKPGWRWDGVDRSNGFERKWFAVRNKARDRQELEYMWQMDE